MDKCEECDASLEGGDNLCTAHDDCVYCDDCCSDTDVLTPMTDEEKERQMEFVSSMAEVCEQVSEDDEEYL